MEMFRTVSPGSSKHTVRPAAAAAPRRGLLLHTYVDGVAVAEWLKIDRSLGVLAVDDDDADDGKKPDHCSSHNGLKSALKDLSCYHFKKTVTKSSFLSNVLPFP